MPIFELGCSTLRLSACLSFELANLFFPNCHSLGQRFSASGFLTWDQMIPCCGVFLAYCRMLRSAPSPTPAQPEVSPDSASCPLEGGVRTLGLDCYWHVSDTSISHISLLSFTSRFHSWLAQQSFPHSKDIQILF